MRLALIALLSAVVMLACRGVATPEYPPVTSEVTAACSNLNRLGCPEGKGSVGGVSCVEIVARRHDLRPLPLTCWASADSISIAMGCGSLRCLR